MPRRFPRPAICLVTAGVARADDDRAANAIVDRVARAAAAGVALVQVRESNLSDAALLAVVQRALAAVDRSRTAVVVNDRTDVAVASGADGVHLRADAMPASRIRNIAPDAFLIGRSVHSSAEARAAEADGGVDYLIFGTVFPSSGKPAGHPVAGLTALRDVCSAVRLPVIAIGGMGIDRAAEVAAAGAAGVAGIGMFADADRDESRGISALVRDVRRAFG